MEIRSPLLFCLLALIMTHFLGGARGVKCSPHHSDQFSRSNFPDGFIFGASSSAYQYEGEASEDGRKPSMWDDFSHKQTEKIEDHSSGDVANDFYHHYKEDMIVMKEMGLDAFRLSISWSRVIPSGKISGGVNPLGVKFYNDLINNLLSNGLQPYVTLFHWDVPQALIDEYGGFLSQNIVDDFWEYANFCFRTFGDRIKHWLTMNEPYEFCTYGYGYGYYAPGRCSNYIGNCTSGNSATEPYIVGHHLILSHGAAVKLYREKYKAFQKGQIGITLSSNWFVPVSQNVANRKAALRAIDFMLGWFLHPMTYGEYPEIMRSLVKNRLPNFTTTQSKVLRNSYDFLGMNYYTSYYAANAMVLTSMNLSMTTDNHVIFSTEKDGVPIGQPTDLSWLHMYPKGIRALILYIKDYYGNPPIVITENGVGDVDNSTLPIKEALEDNLRILYHHGHLTYLSEAIKEGANVKGYFVWSFLDDWEWSYGFSVRFGMNYVDYKNGLKRYHKCSVFWFKKFLQRKKLLSKPSTSQWLVKGNNTHFISKDSYLSSV